MPRSRRSCRPDSGLARPENRQPRDVACLRSDTARKRRGGFYVAECRAGRPTGLYALERSPAGEALPGWHAGGGRHRCRGLRSRNFTVLFRKVSPTNRVIEGEGPPCCPGPASRSRCLWLWTTRQSDFCKVFWPIPLSEVWLENNDLSSPVTFTRSPSAPFKGATSSSPPSA